MKSLLLMRHAKSSWKDTSLYDHERPLNKRGKRDAPRMGLLVNDKAIVPDVILCSTASRARQTIDRFLETCDFSGDIKYSDSLYHADYATYLELLSNLDDDFHRAMIVGHNPEMSYFLQVICDAYEHMPTAALAEISFQIDDWISLKTNWDGTLDNIWKPREIDY